MVKRATVKRATVKCRVGVGREECGDAGIGSDGGGGNWTKT